jgi:nitrate/nitrite transporter NarK
MAQQIAVPRVAVGEYGWRVVFSGMGINLALGILYTWSVIAGGIPEEWGWDQADKSWPYSIACLVFCLIMVPAGRMQDKFGPRIVAAIGGILVGIGFIVASMTTSLVGFIIGFGVLAGAGIGFGYASATPPAVKWFPPAKTGLIAGIVVSGFGLASVYAAPLAKWLTVEYGLQRMMLILGVSFLLLITGLKTLLTPLWFGLSQMLQAPDPNMMQLREFKEHMAGDVKKEAPVHDKDNLTPKEMLRTPQFYMLWFMYACGAGAGLMIISVVKKIVKAQVSSESLAIAAVVGLAIGNGGGRIIAGMLSDKLGRRLTLFIFLVFQAILILLLTMAKEGSVLATAPALITITALIGASYGSNLALFPSITKDFFGLKNFGMNYGLVFTAWGVGGFMLAKLAGIMYVKTGGSFNFAYYTASALLVAAAIMVFFLKPPKHLE